MKIKFWELFRSKNKIPPIAQQSTQEWAKKRGSFSYHRFNEQIMDAPYNQIPRSLLRQVKYRNEDNGKNGSDNYRARNRFCKNYGLWASYGNLKVTIGERDRIRILEFIKSKRHIEVSFKVHAERKDSHFHLYTPIFFKQRGERAHTEIDLADQDRYIRELIKTRRPLEDLKKEILALERCWIHSHTSVGRCWWSLEDDENCERQNNNEFLVSIVVRLDARDNLCYNCRLDIYPPTQEKKEALEKMGVYHPGRLTLANLTVEVIDDRDPDFDPKKIKGEMDRIAQEKVEEKICPREISGIRYFEKFKRKEYWNWD